MSWRLNEFVVRGEIRNGARNSVSGWLEVLRNEKHGGTETIESSLVMLSFTGNLSGKLDGRTFRFEVKERDLPQPRPVLEKEFRSDQVGAMGDSVYRMVRVPLIPLDEYLEACDLGETPPEEQRSSISLEWYSQNGRVVLELLDPKIEFEGDYRDLADPEPEPIPSPEDVGPPEFTTVVRNDDGTFAVIRESGDQPDSTDDEDQFDLFPANLEEQIRLSASEPDPGSGSSDFNDDAEYPWPDETRDNEQTPAKTRSWDEVIPGIDPETRAMYEQWDEVVHGTKDEPLTWLFEEPLCLPRPDDVRDEQHAWEVLLSLLTAMALRGVAFDMCPHFTAMQAYRLLIEDLLPEAVVHPQLASTGFVQHYSSWESCPVCDAEFEGDYRKRNPEK